MSLSELFAIKSSALFGIRGRGGLRARAWSLAKRNRRCAARADIPYRTGTFTGSPQSRRPSIDRRRSGCSAIRHPAPLGRYHLPRPADAVDHFCTSDFLRSTWGPHSATNRRCVMVPICVPSGLRNRDPMALPVPRPQSDARARDSVSRRNQPKTLRIRACLLGFPSPKR